MIEDDLTRPLVLLHHDPPYLTVDADRGIFTVILVLSDLATEKICSSFLP
jgi:hypothetical protein